MTWVKVEEKPTAQSVTLTMLTTLHSGFLYGAAACWVRIGRQTVRAVACIAGPRKLILLPADAAQFLTTHGLPGEIADELVADALAKEA